MPSGKKRMSAGKKNTRFVVSVLAAIFFTTGPSWCDELTSGAPAEANDSLDGILSQAVPDSDLSVQGQGLEVNIGDIGLNAASNSAVVTGNQVSGRVDTGQISNNSFSDVSGINSVMFNTGNNVSFQSNMQVNVILK
jgi:hypothetical protein